MQSRSIKPEVGVIIQQKVRKTCFDAHAGGKWHLNAQCMQANLIGEYILGIRCGH